MKAYSKDLRLKVLAAVDRGMPRAQVAKTFGMSASTIKRYLRLRRQTGDVEPKPIFLTGVLAKSKFHRAGVLQDQSLPQESGCAHAWSVGGSDWRSAVGRHTTRRRGMVCSLRLQGRRSTFMNTAVRCSISQAIWNGAPTSRRMLLALPKHAGEFSGY